MKSNSACPDVIKAEDKTLFEASFHLLLKCSAKLINRRLRNKEEQSRTYIFQEDLGECTGSSSRMRKGFGTENCSKQSPTSTNGSQVLLEANSRLIHYT